MEYPSIPKANSFAKDFQICNFYFAFIFGQALCLLPNGH